MDAPNHNPGDVEIGDIVIEGQDWSQNFVSIVFKEHMMSPFVKGSVRINQYDGSMGSLTGTEPSSVSFRTPGGTKRRYSGLLTNSINDIKTDDNQRSRNFNVDLISGHAIRNNFTPNYQKSFKNLQFSEMLRSVLTDGLGIDIPLNIDQTKGIQGSDYQPIILTQKSPLRHADDIRRMAVSNENYDGFLLFSGIGESGGEEMFFKNVYDLIKKSPVDTITHMTGYEINSSLDAPVMNNAIEVFLGRSTEAMEKGHGFGVGTTKYDIQRGVASIPGLEFGKGRQSFGSQTSLNPGNLSNFVSDPYNGMPGTYNVILEDSRRPDTTRAETAPYTESLFTDMMQNFTTIKVHGNSNYKLGDIINFEMRDNTDMFLNKDTQFYGKNMIVGMTHYIGPISDRPRYVTYLDLVNIQTYNGKIK